MVRVLARIVLASVAAGVAEALAYRHDWVAAAIAAAVVLVPAVAWVAGQFATTAAMMRSLMAEALREASPSAAGKHRIRLR